MKHIIRMEAGRARVSRFAVMVAGVGILAGLTGCYRRSQPDGSTSAIKTPPEPRDTLLIDDPATAEWARNPNRSAGTVIVFKLDNPSEVVSKVYNRNGDWVRTLCSTFVAVPGDYHINWSGVDATGRALPSAIYFYRLTANDTTITRKMVIRR